MQQRSGFFTRLVDLWRGFWGTKLEGAEARNAALVYHNAIAQRSNQYTKLKEAVGRLVYLRNRLEADLMQRQRDLDLVEQSLARTAADGEDAKALALIRKKRALLTELERLHGEHDRIAVQVDSAKEGLAKLKGSITTLQAERTEMLARKQHAVARIEVNQALESSQGEIGTGALDSVREAITRLEYQAELTTEEEFATSGEISLAELRRDAEEESDLAELEALKARLGRPRLPAAGHNGGHEATLEVTS